SHAAAYAVLAYRTAYLKANYRAEFMAALIADSVSRPDKVAQYALACTRAGILVKAPDVNRSEGDAMPETGGDGALSIRLGLFSVKHVGVGAVARLVEERKQRGPFRSLADLCARVDSRALTKRVLESLIKAGACDGWELSRQTLLKQLDALGKNDRPQTAGERSGGPNSRQLSLLEGTERKASEDVEVRDDAERLQGDDDAEAMRQQDEWEKELIGFVVSRQPYAHLQKWREALAVVPLAQIVQGAVSTTGGDRLHHLVADVAGLRTVKTKKGEAMGFLTLEDDSGRMEVVLFPSVYRNLDPLPKVGETLSVHARQDPGGNKSWIATRCFAPEWPVPAQPLIAKRSETKPQKRTLYLKITRALEIDHQQMAVLREILLQRPGEDTVVLFYESGKKRSLDAVRVCADARLVEALTTVIDREAIRVRAQGE
ncbi:MAG: hypothetical protein OWT28_00100, partial [Firmicutes bacterium]|nr:hypothetical protein [Bacillota bacterium]